MCAVRLGAACPLACRNPAPTRGAPFLSPAECDSPYDTRYKPERILIYDKHPGGIGIAAAVRCARGASCVGLTQSPTGAGGQHRC